MPDGDVSGGADMGLREEAWSLTSMPMTGIRVTISRILQKEKSRPPSILSPGHAVGNRRLSAGRSAVRAGCQLVPVSATPHSSWRGLQCGVIQCWSIVDEQSGLARKGY